VDRFLTRELLTFLAVGGTGYLADHDIRTTPAYDGPSGLAAARQPDVDAVLLDLMLPGMSGPTCASSCAAKRTTFPF
jgi:DNA-binding response OmpR family regulator